MWLEAIVVNTAQLEITWGKKGIKSDICITLDS